MTQAVSLAQLGNGPAFSASGTLQSAPSNNTYTKLIFGTEIFDTNSSYETATSRFQPTTAGYYQMSVTLQIDNIQPSGTYLDVYFYKNGSSYSKSISANSQSYPLLTGLVVVYLNGSTDYVESYQIQSGTPRITNNLAFSGIFVRGA